MRAFNLFCLWKGMIPYKGDQLAAADVKTGYYRLFRKEDAQCPQCPVDRICPHCGAVNGVKFEEVK